jgi:hypothetical protein
MKLSPLFLATLLALTPVTVAQADPVTLTGGFMSGVGLGLRFDFQGNGFRAFGSFEPGVIGPQFTCTPCVEGESIRLDSSFGGTLGFGTATVGGTTFTDIEFGGLMDFAAPQVIAPGIRGDFTVTENFTFTARLQGAVSGSSDPALFTQLLTGRGLVTASFRQSGDPLIDPPMFDFASVRYDFTAEDPAPVPEPGTLLLVASGLGAALRYRKRRVA